ncbi:MAG: glycosyltransferase, partial [Dehalococcoidia bacterium]|nr:glycosyltransferase [Dehalococcoidia bacterium]
MKILLFSGTLQVCPPHGYGAEVATWDLAEALGKLGHEVLLAAPPGSKTPTRGHLVEVPKTTPDQRSPNWLEVEWKAAFELAQGAAREVDVVHDLSCSVALHRAACAGGGIDPTWRGSPPRCAVPHLYTQNGISWYEPRSSRHNVIVVSSAAQASAVQGRDEWADTVLEGARHPPLESSRVVRYGCDTNFYRPSLEGYEKTLVAYVGRPHPH